MFLSQEQEKVIARLEYARLFPGLIPSGFGTEHFHSPCDAAYNCIAWAAGHDDNTWWPTENDVEGNYWPPEAPRNTLIQSFIKAFEIVCDYQGCENGDYEPGFDKVALKWHFSVRTAPQSFTQQSRWTKPTGGVS